MAMLLPPPVRFGLVQYVPPRINPNRKRLVEEAASMNSTYPCTCSEHADESTLSTLPETTVSDPLAFDGENVDEVEAVVEVVPVKVAGGKDDARDSEGETPPPEDAASESEQDDTDAMVAAPVSAETAETDVDNAGDIEPDESGSDAMTASGIEAGENPEADGENKTEIASAANVAEDDGAESGVEGDSAATSSAENADAEEPDESYSEAGVETVEEAEDTEASSEDVDAETAPRPDDPDEPDDDDDTHADSAGLDAKPASRRETAVSQDDDRIRGCEQVLGYTFFDKKLIKTALTHSSSTSDKRLDNERLEFFGDAVLDLVIREFLYHNYPNHQEGDLTEAKSAVVCRASLAKASKKMDLKSFLFLGRGIGKKRGIPDSLLADAYEAIVAAIYLDGGYQPVKNFILMTLKAEIPRAIEQANSTNYKSNLQKLLQQRKRPLPTYKVLASTGPEHSRTFEVAVIIDDEEMGRGSGSSKKAAEQEAARAALSELGDEPDE